MDERAVVCASGDSGAPAVCVFHFHADDARYGETDKTREQGRIVYYFVGWEIKMHKRTIPLAISTIILALAVSGPVDAAGQGRAGLRERQQQQRERAPRARPDQRRAVPREAAPPDSRARRRTAPRNSGRRGVVNNGIYYGRRGFGPRGYGQLNFGSFGGYGSRSYLNFNFQLGGRRGYSSPRYYPPYYGGCGYWDELDYTIVYRGGRPVREYFCISMAR